MPLPSTGYATATVSNPSSALTDFTLLVDLSTMPASWWSAVDTSDGTKGRAAKDDGTELATDWIDFDNGAQTGWLRVKWSGTLASTGTQVLRIYPPVSANSSNGVSDTYGQYNAYVSSNEADWPLMADANDRTSNAHNGTTSGGITIGGISGKIGNATAFDGTDDHIRFDHDADLEPRFDCTFMVWSGLNTGTSEWFWKRGDSNDGWAFRVASATVHAIMFGVADRSLAGPGSGWKHIAARIDASGNLSVYFDGAFTASATFAIVANPGTTYAYTGVSQDGAGGLGTHAPAQIQEMKLYTADKGASWIAEEFDQSNNQASFWGSWSWNAGGAATGAAIVGGVAFPGFAIAGPGGLAS